MSRKAGPDQQFVRRQFIDLAFVNDTDTSGALVQHMADLVVDLGQALGRPLFHRDLAPLRIL